MICFDRESAKNLRPGDKVRVHRKYTDAITAKINFTVVEIIQTEVEVYIRVEEMSGSNPCYLFCVAPPKYKNAKLNRGGNV